MTNYCISDEAIVIIGYQQIFRCYNVDKSEERMYKYFFFFLVVRESQPVEKIKMLMNVIAKFCFGILLELLRPVW